VIEGGPEAATLRQRSLRLSLAAFIEQEERRALTESAVAEISPAVHYIITLSSQCSRESMFRNLRRVARYLRTTVGEINWKQITFVEVERLRSRMLFDGLAPATVNATLSAIRGVMRQARRSKLISQEQLDRILEVKPAEGVRLQRARALSLEELAALFTACAQGRGRSLVAARDAALLALLAGAGLRKSEAIELQLSNFNHRERTLTVIGKGNKERRIFLEDKGTLRALTDWIVLRGGKPGPFLCSITRQGEVSLKPLSQDAPYKIVLRRSCEARLESTCTPHGLRHTFATHLLDQGAEITDVQQLLGHARVETTQIYDHRKEKGQRRAMRLVVLPFKRRRKLRPRKAKRRGRRRRRKE
jgi:site-specific recombinase XerD